MIKGSHRGILYDGTNFLDADDPTAPLHDGSTLPRLPDIEAERKTDPKKYEFLSWATRPGDIVVLHPGMLHGGAPVDATFRNRHTLVLCFFGDDSFFRSLPNHSDSGYTTAGVLFVDQLGHLKGWRPVSRFVLQAGSMKEAEELLRGNTRPTSATWQRGSAHETNTHKSKRNPADVRCVSFFADESRRRLDLDLRPGRSRRQAT